MAFDKNCPRISSAKVQKVVLGREASHLSLNWPFHFGAVASPGACMPSSLAYLGESHDVCTASWFAVC